MDKVDKVVLEETVVLVVLVDKVEQLNIQDGCRTVDNTQTPIVPNRVGVGLMVDTTYSILLDMDTLVLTIVTTATSIYYITVEPVELEVLLVEPVELAETVA